MKREKRLQTKHISDVQVLWAYVESSRRNHDMWPYDVLQRDLGVPLKVAYAAMERADRRGLVEYGVSLRSGWVTDQGLLKLARAAGCALAELERALGDAGD
jgi:hypothetical protein